MSPLSLVEGRRRGDHLRPGLSMAVPCTGCPPARVPDRLPRHHRATRCERATVCSGSIQRVECLISAGSFGAVHGCVGQIDEVVDQRAVVVARGSRECSRWRRGERGLGPVLSEAHGLPVRTIAPTIGHKRFLSGVTTRARRRQPQNRRLSKSPAHRSQRPSPRVPRRHDLSAHWVT